MSKKLKNLAVFFCAVFIGLVLCEILVRIVLFSSCPRNLVRTNKHHLFANFYVDDNAYRLRMKWSLDGREGEQVFSQFDPVLGWTAVPRVRENPFGVVTNSKYSLSELKSCRAMLFFGDSFVEGLTEIESKIPQLLDAKLDRQVVWNFGVSGYGLDQMYLRVQEVIEYFDKPHILIGVLYQDLDRTIYKVRHSAKPYFEIMDDNLSLKGVPIPRDYNKMLESYPPTIISYALNGFAGGLRSLLNTRLGVEHLFMFHPSESLERRRDKEKICKKIIEGIKTECLKNNAALTFILFPHNFHMIHLGWYETYLKRLLRDMEIEFIDLKLPLEAYLKSNEIDWYTEFYTLDNHPNEVENAIIANYITERLHSLYGYEYQTKAQKRKPRSN